MASKHPDIGKPKELQRQLPVTRPGGFTEGALTSSELHVYKRRLLTNASHNRLV